MTIPNISTVGKWLDIDDDLYHPPMLIRIAQKHGMGLSPEQEELTRRGETLELDVAANRALIALTDDAEDYMNSVAPDGYRFGWFRDEFMFWPDAWWEIDRPDQ